MLWQLWDINAVAQLVACTFEALQHVVRKDVGAEAVRRCELVKAEIHVHRMNFSI